MLNMKKGHVCYSYGTRLVTLQLLVTHLLLAWADFAGRDVDTQL